MVFTSNSFLLIFCDDKEAAVNVHSKCENEKRFKGTLRGAHKQKFIALMFHTKLI